jgi:hypothetical protein
MIVYAKPATGVISKGAADCLILFLMIGRKEEGLGVPREVTIKDPKKLPLFLQEVCVMEKRKPLFDPFSWFWLILLRLTVIM